MSSSSRNRRAGSDARATNELSPTSTPAVEAGRLYTGAGDDGLLCLDAATGKILWSYASV